MKKLVEARFESPRSALNHEAPLDKLCHPSGGCSPREMGVTVVPTSWCCFERLNETA